VGASVALDIGDGTTQSDIASGATLAHARDLTLTAQSTDTMTSTAQNGAAGGTGVTPDVAISISNVTTGATIGSGPALAVTGSVTANATQAAPVATTAP